jgi:hypothetical protein
MGIFWDSSGEFGVRREKREERREKTGREKREKREERKWEEIKCNGIVSVKFKYFTFSLFSLLFSL